jgi:hypothetical protein
VPSSDDDDEAVAAAPAPNFRINDLASSITSHPDEEIPESDEPPDDLKLADRQEAAALISLFGADPVKRFFSQSWNLRLHGIKKLSAAICDLASGYAAAFHCFCHIIRHRMGDNQKQVVIAALNAVRDMAETHQMEPADLKKGVNCFVVEAAARIGGQQATVSDAVCEFLLWLSQRGAMDVALPVVMTPSKNPAQWKAHLGRLTTLHDIICLHGIDTEPGLFVQDVMKFIIPSLESPKVEVRQAVIKIIVGIQETVGNAVNRYLDGLPPRTKREVQKAIEKHDD